LPVVQDGRHDRKGRVQGTFILSIGIAARQPLFWLIYMVAGVITAPGRPGHLLARRSFASVDDWY